MKRLAWVVLLTAIVVSDAFAFISRQYSIEEVIEESTHILFGSVESVDRGKQRVVLAVDRYIKGQPEFQRIKVNVAVGQVLKGKTSPAMLLEKTRAKEPAIVCYENKGGSLACLVYTSGTWFQAFGRAKPDLSKVWWNYTHIEIHMPRTYQGSVEQLQDIVMAEVSGVEGFGAADGARVLALVGTGSTHEIGVLRTVAEVGEWKVSLRQTSDPNLPMLEDADVLWLGFREIDRNGHHLRRAAENRIQAFVERGGVVVVSGQDYDVDQPMRTGWTPEAIEGSEINAMPVTATGDLGELLQSPRQVDPRQIVIDDAWVNASAKYTVGLQTEDRKNIVLARLQHGDGLYLLAALRNDGQQSVDANRPLMENLLHYGVRWAMTHAPKPAKVLALGGSLSVHEVAALRGVGKVGEWRVTVTETTDTSLPGLDDADVLWLGFRTVDRDGHHLNPSTENRIRAFVQGGGVVIVSGQDYDVDQPMRTGWTPEQIDGSEINPMPVRSAGALEKLLVEPRRVDIGRLVIDDAWKNASDKYSVALRTEDGQNIVLAELRHGDGLYLIVALKNDQPQSVEANRPLMENLIHYGVHWAMRRVGGS